MKKGEIYEGIVEKIEFPNKGILHIEDEKVIVKNALPGQKIQFLVNKKRKGKCEGRLMQVLERSEIETAETVCPHFGICGGCLYQTIPYETQLEITKEQVKELLLQAGMEFVAAYDAFTHDPVTAESERMYIIARPKRI